MKKAAESGNGREQGVLNAFLDQGSQFEGKLTFQGTVRIDGKFQGQVFSKDTLYIGQTGELEGAVEVGEAIISGRVKGTIVCAERLRLQATAVVEGDVTTKMFIVEEGARIEGRVQMPAAPSGLTRVEAQRLERAVETALVNR